MFQSLMKTDIREPDVLISETTHSTAEINMIPPPAPQDGLVMSPPTNVLWPTQEMALEVNQPVKTTARVQTHHQARHSDATPPTIFARHVKTVMKDALKTNQLLVQTARTQIQTQTTTSVTELTQIIQNVVHAKKERVAANPNKKPVKAAHQRKNFMNVTSRLLPVFRLKTKVASSKLVMLSVDTTPHQSSRVPGEDSWPSSVKQRTSTWVRLI